MSKMSNHRLDIEGVTLFKRLVRRSKKASLWVVQDETIRCFTIKTTRDVEAFHDGDSLTSLDDEEILRRYRRARRLVVLELNYDPVLVEKLPDCLIRIVKKHQPQVRTLDILGKATASLKCRGKNVITRPVHRRQPRHPKVASFATTGTRPVRRRPKRHPTVVDANTWANKNEIPVYSVCNPATSSFGKPLVQPQIETDWCEPDSAVRHIAIGSATTRDDVRNLGARQGKMVTSSSPWFRQFSRPKFPTKRPAHPVYYLPEERLKTYRLWDTANKPSPDEMVGSGFFSPGRGDLVRCFQCGIGLKDWCAGDDPLTEHIRASNNCQFLVSELGQDVIDDIKAEVLAPVEHDAAFQNETDSISSTISASASSREREPVSNDLPFPVMSPSFQTMEARLESLKQLPQSVKQSRRNIAVAGFFYTGYGDLCRCFACDGGLKAWDPNDDPMEEHAKHFPTCSYLKHVKGDRYIHDIQAKVQGVTASRESPSNGNQPINVYGSTGRSDFQFDPGNAEIGEDSTELQSEEARSALGMGFSTRSVIDALSHLRLQGTTRPTTEQLVNAVLAI